MYPPQLKTITPKIGRKKVDFSIAIGNQMIFFEVTCLNLSRDLEIGQSQTRTKSRIFDQVGEEITDHFMSVEDFKNPYIIIINDHYFSETDLDIRSIFYGSPGLEMRQYKDTTRRVIDVKTFPKLLDDSLLSEPAIKKGLRNLNGIILYQRIRNEDRYYIRGEYYQNPEVAETGKLPLKIIKKLIRLFKEKSQ